MTAWELQQCPSWGAYQRHLKNDQAACDGCLEVARKRSEALRGGPNPRALQSCGTPAARQRHLKRREPVCEVCRVAHNAWQNEYRAARRAQKLQWARAATVARVGTA